MKDPLRSDGIRFGVFEFDPRAEELRKSGLKLRLRGQAFQVLAMLLEHPGEVVTREDLQQRLWPKGTFVDFDHGLNTAINKIREVLGDSAESPRFVETLARRGYRFIAAVENSGREIQTEKASPEAEKEPPHRRSWWAGRLVWLIALSVLVMAGMAWLYLSRFGSRSLILPPMKVVRLTSFPGKETEPVLSPDGKMVAFVWDGEKGDNADIYAMLVDSGKPVRLTTDPAPDFGPTWSPDGRFIAFQRQSKEKSDIYLIPGPYREGPERRLAEVELSPILGYERVLDWSPDGQSLLVSHQFSKDRRASLFLLSVETGEKKQITFPNSDFRYKGAAFSPDGQTLAFTGSPYEFSETDIYAMPTLGGEVKRLTSDQRSTQAVWSADGREIIFAHDNGGLYRVPVDGGKATLLAEGGQFGFFPSISREGNRLVYSEQSFEADIWRIDLSSSGTKGTSATPLIFSSRQEDIPYFSPDGKKIVFDSTRSGSLEIWTCDSDGRNPLRLTSIGNPHTTGTSRWAPDGKLIAFDSTVNGFADIFVISPQGGSPRRRTMEPSADFVPSWSRDSRWIYFCSDRGRQGNWQIWKMPAEGGPASQVTHNGGFEALESFDRKFLFYSKRDPPDEIWKIPVAGGQESLFLKGVEPRYWAVGDKGIYFLATENMNFPSNSSTLRPYASPRLCGWKKN
jgi:Tol biopolymer transport system component/DNA-binding winged helix-turn-helix (wHTH) protein